MSLSFEGQTGVDSSGLAVGIDCPTSRRQREMAVSDAISAVYLHIDLTIPAQQRMAEEALDRLTYPKVNI